jgi:hypothetical protein
MPHRLLCRRNSETLKYNRGEPNVQKTTSQKNIPMLIWQVHRLYKKPDHGFKLRFYPQALRFAIFQCRVCLEGLTVHFASLFHWDFLDGLIFSPIFSF